MAHRPNFTAQLSDKEALNEIAQNLGCIQTRGPFVGEGSVRRMLEEITFGDVLCIQNVFDEKEEMLNAAEIVRELAVPFDDGLVFETLNQLATALQTAALQTTALTAAASRKDTNRPAPG